MNSDKRPEYLSRENILRVLSDEEVALVSTAETAPCLLVGDEYLDLEHLDLGVRRARGPTRPMGRLLPRKAVHDDTWTKIVGQLPRPLMRRVFHPLQARQTKSFSGDGVTETVAKSRLMKRHS
jgi:hypothetical protein